MVVCVYTGGEREREREREREKEREAPHTCAISIMHALGALIKPQELYFSTWTMD